MFIRLEPLHPWLMSVLFGTVVQYMVFSEAFCLLLFG